MTRTDVTGYVLAGGHSSRMGQDKALMELKGVPLIARAVAKLRGVAKEVRILSGKPEFAIYGHLVPDLRKEKGPLAAVEAALADMETPWALLLAVDMPFVPLDLLKSWVDSVISQRDVRIAIMEAEGKTHPALCLIHRDAAATFGRLLDQERLKLYHALEEAANDIAQRKGGRLQDVLNISDALEPGMEQRVAAPLWKHRHLWFANLNTPTEFAAAEELEEML